MALHPVLAQMLASSEDDGSALSAGSPTDARTAVSQRAAAFGRGPEVGDVRQVDIPTRGGSIPGKLFRPARPARGLIVYLHGGGWVAGCSDDYEVVTRTLVARSDCALLSVDYRLAPENPFPAGLEDAEDAIRWASDLRAELFSSQMPLIIAGDSAGANLATVTAMTLRMEVKLALQLLFYPITDAGMNTPSYSQYQNGPLLTAGDMQWFYDHYAPEYLRLDPRISPLRASDFSHVPPCWIATAEHDVLRDEGESYAACLARAGVPVMLRRYDGLTHGFARMVNLLDTADSALSDAAAAIIAHCGKPAL